MHTRIFVLLIFVSITLNTIAQDTLRQCKGQFILGKVLSSDHRQITFETKIGDQTIIKKIKLRDLYSIGYSDGKTEKIKLKKSCYWWDSIQSRAYTAIKPGIVGPLYGYHDLIFETAVGEMTSLELRTGLINTELLNGSQARNTPSKGFFIQPGWKFIFHANRLRKKSKHLHPLLGPFLGVDLLYSTFTQQDIILSSYDLSGNAYPEILSTRKKTAIGLMVKAGFQAQLTRWLLFGANVGFGGGYMNEKFAHPDLDRHYTPEGDLSHSSFSYLGDPEVPIIASANVYVGFVIRHKRKLFDLEVKKNYRTIPRR